MRTFSSLWQAYRAEASPTWVYEYKCIIDALEYSDAEIYTFDKAGGLISDDFSLGNCILQQFDITVTAKSGVTVAKNAKVEPYVRINGENGATSWYRLGVFFINNRGKLNGGKVPFKCYDRMAFLDVPFLQDGESLDDYPMPMSTAMTRIYTQLGTTLDIRCTVSSVMTIEYPNDMTMRQVLGMIASAHGGNAVITDEDYLRIVTPGYSGSVLAAVDGSNSVKTYAGNDAVTYDSVAMIYTDDGSYFESGTTKNNELEITNYWATQSICNAVQTAINGYTYTPYTAEGADLDPALELGDHITIDGYNCNLWTWKWNNRLYCDIEIPSSSDTTTSEFGYTGTLKQAVSKKVTLNESYYGTSISRSKGIFIGRSDGNSEAQFNSDVLAMRVLKNGSMVDQLYVGTDPDTGDPTFYYAGKLTADLINAISAVITPNLYTNKATIAELTVDQLDTGSKVLNYLNSDTSDVNYIKIYDQYIQFITASTTGSSTIQATNRDSQALYWTDNTHSAATTTVTDYPVVIYVYTEMVKAQYSFESDGGNYIPKIVLGAGSGNTQDSGKTFIYKATDGFYIDYRHSVTGASTIFKITDSGIDLSMFPTIKYSEQLALIGIPQLWVGTASEIGSANTKLKDVAVITDNYSRYDILSLTNNTTLSVSDNEVILASGTFTLTLHAATSAGIIKKVYNTGTGLITIAGTINGVTNIYLYPGESVELVTDGSGWRY